MWCEHLSFEVGGWAAGMSLEAPLCEEWQGPQFACGTAGAWGHMPGMARGVFFPFCGIFGFGNWACGCCRLVKNTGVTCACRSWTEGLCVEAEVETPSEWVDFTLKAADFVPPSESESSPRGGCRCLHPGAQGLYHPHQRPPETLARVYQRCFARSPDLKEARMLGTRKAMLSSSDSEGETYTT